MNYLYKITNLLNNKIYIGVHKTDDINDGYMGSGSVIKSAIKKYGIENFKKEVLEFFDTYTLALTKEAEIVTDEFLLREDVYNLRRGGTGGFDYINKLPDILDHRRRNGLKTQSLGVMQKTHDAGNLSHVYFSNDKEKQKIANAKSQESAAILKKKETFATIKHQQGAANSQYGTCWVTNSKESKKIKKNELEFYLNSGWRKGRILGC